MASSTYLLAVDRSQNTLWGLHLVLSMISSTDVLHLLTIRSVTNDGLLFSSTTNQRQIEMLHTSETRRCKKLLGSYYLKTRQLGFTGKLTLSIGNGHVGTTVCSYVAENHINFLVLGKRRMGRVSRFFSFSTSKYCIEHAECNVLVVKQEVQQQVSRKDSNVRLTEKVERKRPKIVEFQDSTGHLHSCHMPNLFSDEEDQLEGERKPPDHMNESLTTSY